MKKRGEIKEKKDKKRLSLREQEVQGNGRR